MKTETEIREMRYKANVERLELMQNWLHLVNSNAPLKACRDKYYELTAIEAKCNLLSEIIED